MSTISAWELDTFYTPQDVIIAGSGFAGLWTAYHLKKYRPHWNILIIEKSPVPGGASTRNAGFACFGSATELVADAGIIGESQMLATFATRYEGIRRIRSVFEPSLIDYEHLGGYELISAKQYPDEQGLLADLRWLNEVLKPITSEKETFRSAPGKLKSFGFRHTSQLIENNLEGQLHPGKLHAALVMLLKSSGVRIITGIALDAWSDSGPEPELQTFPAIPLKARHLVIATNIPGNNLIPGNGVMPARGQVLLTSGIERLPFSGSFHYDEGYYYFRNLGNRVLLGGARNLAFEEEATVEPGVSPVIQEALERFLREVVLPGIPFQIEQRWSGTMGMPPGKETVVRRLSNHCYAAVGLGGIGVAVAPIVGEQVANLLLES